LITKFYCEKNPNTDTVQENEIRSEDDTSQSVRPRGHRTLKTTEEEL
jgi:hypothetical protein